MSAVESRALITGVGGQDGTYLAERLLADGIEVHALVLDADRRAPYVPADVILHAGDVSRIEETRRLVTDLRPGLLFNLAAISSVAQSWDSPDTTAQVNGAAAAGLMESARQVGGVRFVQASSAEIFGEPASAPQDESTPIHPINPYGAAKAYAHLSAGVFRARGEHVSSLVLYNHESPRRPERFVTRKITATVAAIARGEADELLLGNLDARRDWGWAPDYVDAMLRTARAESGDDFVIATGQAHSVRDFVAAAFAAAGLTDWEPLVKQDPRFLRPADPTELVGDPTKAREVLGWEPSLAFDEVVTAMVAHDLAVGVGG